MRAALPPKRRPASSCAAVVPEPVGFSLLDYSPVISPCFCAPWVLRRLSWRLPWVLPPVSVAPYRCPHLSVPTTRVYWAYIDVGTHIPGASLKDDSPPAGNWSPRAGLNGPEPPEIWPGGQKAPVYRGIWVLSLGGTSPNTPGGIELGGTPLFGHRCTPIDSPPVFPRVKSKGFSPLPQSFFALWRNFSPPEFPLGKLVI